MEKRVAKKIETYQVEFKNAIKKWMEDSKCRIINSCEDKTTEFLNFMYDYDGFTLSKDDFQKRKRIKNTVPHFDRCIAKRANGDQCTRRKNEGIQLCGTHSKGTPHGMINGGDEEEKEEHHVETKVQIWVEDIKGIHQYIDANNNVYQSEDILSNKNNPKVIAKWKKNELGVYSIIETK